MEVAAPVVTAVVVAALVVVEETVALAVRVKAMIVHNVVDSAVEVVVVVAVEAEAAMVEVAMEAAVAVAVVAGRNKLQMWRMSLSSQALASPPGVRKGHKWLPRSPCTVGQASHNTAHRCS